MADDEIPRPYLDPEDVQASALAHRVLFLLATPRTGAEQILRALGCLPGVVAAPVPTHMFEYGMRRMFDKWVIGGDTNRPQGMALLASDRDWALATRLFADAPLAAAVQATDADVVVEYSASHAAASEMIAHVYPDASLLHVVADGRRVATRMSAGLADRVSAFAAAQRWCDDQRAALDCGHPALNVVRVEDIAADPKVAAAELAALLDVDPGVAIDDVTRQLEPLARVASDLPTGRAAGLVEAMGADLLDHFAYPIGERSVAAMTAAKVDVAANRGWEKTADLGRRLRFAAQTYRHHRRRLTLELAQRAEGEGLPDLTPNLPGRRAPR